MMRPAKALTNSFSNIHSGIAAGERVLSLMDEEPGIRDQPGAVALDGFRDSIRLENVWFSYESKPILNGISLEIPTAKTIAPVGTTAGGKTTFINLTNRKRTEL